MTIALPQAWDGAPLRFRTGDMPDDLKAALGVRRAIRTAMRRPDVSERAKLELSEVVRIKDRDRRLRALADLADRLAAEEVRMASAMERRSRGVSWTD